MIEKARVLVIEDNAPDVFLIEEALRERGVSCRIDQIADGGDAVAFARRQGKYMSAETPHLILLDMNLPRTHGEAVLAALRGETWLTQVPVIVWSSVAHPEQREIVERYGMTRFVLKPANLDEFFALAATIGDVLVNR